MARVLNSLLSRLVLSVLGIHVLLAPVLYLQLGRINYGTETEQFISGVRAHARMLAGILELDIDRLPRQELQDLVDSALFSRDTVYASLTGVGLEVTSALTTVRPSDYVEDFGFGEHNDGAYFLSIPVSSQRYGTVVLRLGFDEEPTVYSLNIAAQRTVTALALFLGLSLVGVIFLSALVAKPLRELRLASQAIADGQLRQPFGVGGQILEIRELAEDLNRMRENLVTANERLEREVAERDRLEKARAELQSTLRHAQKIETIGTLAGGIAHEFNNVLQPMKFYTEMALEDAPEGGTIRPDLRRVLASIDRAKKIVEQILTFSRRSHEEQFERVEVGPVLEDVADLCRGLFPSSVNLDVSIDGNIRPVFADATQIHQLVMNLCSNAFQALKGESGTISISATETVVSDGETTSRGGLQPGEYLQIDVIDDGQGMDPLLLERIFEPFFTTRGPRQGTGLGLSVAHGIVSAHGGGIWAFSELGKGSRFRVCLPVAGPRKPPLLAGGREEDQYDGVYLGSAAALSEHAGLIDRGGLTKWCLRDPEEIYEAVGSALARNKICVVDLSDAEFAEGLVAHKWVQEVLANRHVLVIVPLDAILKRVNLDWSQIRHLVQPFSECDFRSALERLLRGAEKSTAGSVT